MANLISEWFRQAEIIDKFDYRVLPERMDTLSALFVIDMNIFHDFTFTILST
jgi:nitrous oxide reductase accessory protein NosL